MKIPDLNLTDFSDNLCFACGVDNPIGLKLKPVYDGEKVRAEFIPGKYHQGWKDVTHGGILCTVLDEVTAYAIICHGIDYGVTAKSELRFKHVAPIGQPIQASAWATRVTKRLVETEGMLALNDGTVIARGKSIFYVWRLSGKTILWDMDGVITDSGSFHFAAWQEAFAKRGVKLSREDFIRLFGAKNDYIIHSILGTDITQEDLTAMIEEKNKSFRRKIDGNIKPLPGAIKLLDTIKKGNFKQALVTSAPKENIAMVNDELHLEGYFNCIISGSDVAESKPNPQIYLKAAERLEAKPADCVVIEDSPLGVSGARTAGMRCLAVASTRPRQLLEQADMIVDSLEDVDLITLIHRV